jgi:chemotaxis methyl-accepting protein methylase
MGMRRPPKPFMTRAEYGKVMEGLAKKESSFVKATSSRAVRNPEILEKIQKNIMPFLKGRKDVLVQVVGAGISNGVMEERTSPNAYEIAMLMESNGIKSRVAVSDINPEALEVARNTKRVVARIVPSDSPHFPAERREFDRRRMGMLFRLFGKGGVKTERRGVKIIASAGINPEVRGRMEFSGEYDFIHGVPVEKKDLIVATNMMPTDSGMQKALIMNFIDRLKVGGFAVVTENSEAVESVLGGMMQNAREYGVEVSRPLAKRKGTYIIRKLEDADLLG